MNADPLANLAIVLREARDLGGVDAVRKRVDPRLVGGDQKLRDHMPVDGAEALVLVESSRASREGAAVENLLVDVQNSPALGAHGVAMGAGFEPIQGLAQESRVAERGMEVHRAVHVSLDDGGVARRE